MGPGRSKILAGVDTSLRSHYLLVRVAGCAFSTLQLHSDKDKKSTIDLFEPLDPRNRKTWHNGDDKGDIKVTLRAHFTSRPVDADDEALSSSSLSSLLSPSVVGSLVTELVLYTEGAFIDRSGLRLKLRASRQGAYVERCLWQPRMTGKGSAGEKGSDVSSSSSRLEPFSTLVEAGRNLSRILLRQEKLKSQSRFNSKLNKIVSVVSTKDEPVGGVSVSNHIADISRDDAFDLSGFTVQSRRVYRIVPQVRVEDVLYTDRAHLVWFYLPSILR